MTKSGAVLESDKAAKVMEVKKKLWKLVKTIVDEDDYKIETADEAIAALCTLKFFKDSKESLSFKVDDALAVPQQFTCPLSKNLMKDPVVLSTGQVQFFSFLFNSHGFASLSICLHATIFFTF